MNAAETLFEAGRPDAVAIACGDTTITYGGLRQATARAAGAWQALGLGPGDRVIVFAPDSVEWVSTYLGVIWAGGVAIGVNPRLPMNELAPVLADSQVRFLWHQPAAAADLEGLCGRIDGAPQRVCDGAGGDGCLDWRTALTAAPEVASTQRAPSDPALWIGTSGTTGTPKGVVHLQGVTAPCAHFAREVLGATPEDRFYASSKLFFAYALANSLFAGLRLGATVVLDPEWPTPERVEEMVLRHRPTILFSVPTLYHKMLQGGIGERLAVTGIRCYVSAGEALPPTVRAGWRAATGKEIVSGYGTSETLCLMLYSDDDSGLARPTPLSEVKFQEGIDATVPQRIWVRHPAVAGGYWNRPEAQADGFRDGWYSPGDSFLRRDGEHGIRLEFAGRNDDMLKIAGQWVSTLWVEQALVQAAGDSIQQLGVTGVTSSDGLTALSLLVAAVPGREEVARQRIAAAIETLPRIRQPRWTHWVPELPLTPTGKLQRARLRELHRRELERR